MTQDDSPSGEDAWEVEEDEEAAEDAVEPKAAPTTRTTVPPKFKGNSTDLEGYTFDFSDYKQADKYVSTIMTIAEYVGPEYKYGGDIRSTLENEVRITIPQPVTPVAETMPLLESRIFDKEIDIYMKR